MDGKTRIIAGLYFFVFITVYSAHNYMQMMNKELNNIEEKKHGLLDILSLIKFIGAFLISNIADRTGKYGHIIGVGLGGYVVFLYLMFNGHGYSSSGFYLVLIIFYRSFSIFFLSGVFPVLDAVCFEHLDKINKLKEWYGRLRISSCLGHSLGTLSVKYGTKIANEASRAAIPLYMTCIFGMFSILYVWIVLDFLKPEKRLPSVAVRLSFREKMSRNWVHIKEIITLDFVLLLVAILLQGIHRQAVSTYQEKYFETINIDRSQTSTIFAVRCLPEAIMLFITPYFEMAIGIYWMFFLAVIFGFSRPLIYAFLNFEKWSQLKIKILIYFVEILKGIFSALFSYSASKIVKELNTPVNKSTAQGLYNGFYSGLAPVISAFICYVVYDWDAKWNESNERMIFGITGFLGALGLIFIFILTVRKKMKIVT